MEVWVAPRPPPRASRSSRWPGERQSFRYGDPLPTPVVRGGVPSRSVLSCWMGLLARLTDGGLVQLHPLLSRSAVRKIRWQDHRVPADPPAAVSASSACAARV